ncbi:MAG: hypothetical protein R2747_02030 [Pyrinomonadaceae bacterium]
MRENDVFKKIWSGIDGKTGGVLFVVGTEKVEGADSGSAGFSPKADFGPANPGRGKKLKIAAPEDFEFISSSLHYIYKDYDSATMSNVPKVINFASRTRFRSKGSAIRSLGEKVQIY